MYFLTTQKAGTHTSHRNFSSIGLSLCNSHRKPTASHDDIYHGKSTH